MIAGLEYAGTVVVAWVSFLVGFGVAAGMCHRARQRAWQAGFDRGRQEPENLKVGADAAD